MSGENVRIPESTQSSNKEFIDYELDSHTVRSNIVPLMTSYGRGNYTFDRHQIIS